MMPFSSWGADVDFWLSDAPIKIYISNPNLIQGKRKTCVGVEGTKDWPVTSNIFK